MFFKRGAGLTVGEIAGITGAKPRRGTRLDLRITDLAPLDRAGPADLVFLEKQKFAGGAATTAAGACLTTERLESHVPPHVAVLYAREPYRAFVAVARSLFPDSVRPSSLFEGNGQIAAGAFVHDTARVESGVTIDPGVVIGPRAEIGAGTVIAAGAAIGAEVRIGRDCSIGASSTIMHALIGDRVTIHAGVRIGQDGYGYIPGARHERVPQLGRVIIQDDVEVGSNSTIDRGGLRDTVIGEGTKIDNLVQIGHNVMIGRHCLLVAQVGVSGSVSIGDYAVLAGQVGVADHAEIGEGAQIAAQSGVVGQLAAGREFGGSPAIPRKEWLRMTLMLRQMARRNGRSTSGTSGKKDGDGE